MAKVFRLLIAVLGLTFLGYSGPVSAAPDCFQVSEKIKRMSVKDGLLDIKNATRQHLRSFKREGSSYEGQYDIACLIGQYMTLMDGTPSGLSGDETLRRYKDVRRWFAKRFKEDLAEYAKTVALYKNNSDLVEQEREEGYANSEFVLWSLAGSVNDAYLSMPDAEWNTTGLLNEVWCGDPMRAKAQFDQYRRKLPEEARKTNWSVLSESEFERVQAMFRPAPKGLDALCGGADLVISPRDITGLKSRYKNVATAEVKKGWISSLKAAVNIDQKNWKEIAWLGLPCAKAPTKKQYDLFQGLRWYEDNPPSKKWWTDVVQRELAEDLFDERLNERLRRADDACTEMIAQEINDLNKIATRWKTEYRREVLRSLTRVWLEGQKSQNLATKLSELYDHVTLVTGAPKVCTSPSEGDRVAIQMLQVFINRVSDSKSAFRESTTLELFIEAEKYLPAAEEVAARCMAIPQIGLVEDRFKETRQKYRKWAKVKSADVWIDATKGRYDSGWEDIIKHVYAEALPSAQEKRAVAYLYSPEQKISPELEQALSSLPNRLSPLRGDADIYREILDKQRQFAERLEGDILNKWIDTLSSKNCNVVESSTKSASLTPQCLSPSEEDAQVLATYCRLKQLAGSIAKRNEREGNNEGSGGDSGGGAAGGDSGGDSGGGAAMLLPEKPFWDYASAIQVAFLGSWNSEASFKEIILEDPVSGAVADAGFADVGRLQIALSQISKNGHLEESFKSKLRGCNAGRRYKREIRELEELREFYIGAYEALCDSEESSIRRLHCDMAELLYKGRKKTDVGIGDGQGSDKSPENDSRITVVWRSNVEKDWIRVSWMNKKQMGATGLDFKTLIPEGAVVEVEWRLEREKSDNSVRFTFRCCQKEHIEKFSNGTVSVDQNRQGSVLSIWFDSGNTRNPTPTNYDQSCKIYYPSRWGGVVKTLRRRPGFLSEEMTLDVWPKRKVRFSTIKRDIKLGTRIPKTPLFLSAVGTNLLVLFPTDKVDNVAIKDWFKQNDRPTRDFVITLEAMDVSCKIHQ
jgi:hypothetical protein